MASTSESVKVKAKENSEVEISVKESSFLAGDDTKDDKLILDCLKSISDRENEVQPPPSFSNNVASCTEVSTTEIGSKK